jgi:hypothetical protein
MDYPETLETLGTRDTVPRQKLEKPDAANKKQKTHHKTEN